MNKKIKDPGIALISVLFMIMVLIMITTAFISINSNHLFYVSNSYEKLKALNLAEAAIEEAILKLKSDMKWGRFSDDNLFWISENQPLPFIELDYSMKNSLLELPERGLYYITFDKTQSTFPYSVNNLEGDGSVQGWNGKEIPSYSADIIVTAVSGDSVKHIEAIIIQGLRNNLLSGCKGQATFMVRKNFALTSADNNPPNFHSNSQKEWGVKFITDDFRNEITIDGTISACSEIMQYNPVSGNTKYLSNDKFKNNELPKEIPDIDIMNFVNPVPPRSNWLKPGFYLCMTNKSDHTKRDWYYMGKDALGDPEPLTPCDGVKFTDNGYMEISENIMVQYQDGSKGRLVIVGGGVKFKKPDLDIYIPRDSDAIIPKEMYITKTQTYSFQLYDEGSLTIWDPDYIPEDIKENLKTKGLDLISPCTALVGQGNVYAEGSIFLTGAKAIDAGNDIVSLFAHGDISIKALDGDLDFNGIVYSRTGDIYIHSGTDEGIVDFYGAVMARGGGNTSINPGNITILGKRIKIETDIAALRELGSLTVSGNYQIVNWIEF